MTTDTRLQKALLDPSDVFDSPEDVISDGEFSIAQKIEILRRWDYDASEISAAESEGMPVRNGELLQHVLRALGELGVKIDGDRRPPTRQGGLDRRALRAGKPED